jgi:C-terminal processing protease CtpA/Prc
MQRFFDSVERAIGKPMTDQEFLSLLLLLSPKICDGHTMFLPGEARTHYNDSLGKFLPLSLDYKEEKLFVSENDSKDPTLRPGDEIIAINGIPTPEILTQLLNRQVRDGRNETYPEWILSHYFAAYYSFAFGQPDHFTLKFLNSKGSPYSLTLEADTKDSIRAHHRLNTGQITTPGIRLEKPAGEDFAILTIKSFDPPILKAQYNQDFKKAMDSAFMDLGQSHINHLFIDLRDNQGGEFDPCRYLLSWLIQKPTQFLLGGDESRTLQPRPKHFAGSLIVIVNGGSFSSTAITASILQSQQRVIIVGEESGGNKVVISGDPVEKVLPNTGIRCYISTTNFRITDNKNDGHGVIPDYPASLTPGNWPEWRRLLSL